jgi:hypothetical protein
MTAAIPERPHGLIRMEPDGGGRIVGATSAARPAGGDAMIRTLVAIPACALMALAASPARADTTLATGLPATVTVSLRGDAVAWSAPTADGRFKLVIARGGVAADAAVKPSATPFDVDLGDDGHGHLIATYSRCSRPPKGLERPRGCDVYRYDVTARRERRVPGLGAGSASDYLPTAASGRIAFARSIAGGPARLYYRKLGGGALHALRGGLSNRDARTGPTSLDLGRSGLAIAWVARGPAGRDLGYGAQEVRWDPLHGTPRLLSRYIQGDISGTDVVGVSATRSGVFWGSQGNGENGATMLYLIPNLLQSSDSRALTVPIASASGTSLDDAVVLECPAGAACSVVRLTAP